MALPRKILTAALFLPMTLVADDSATANERIPVTKKEMEIHWKVDCSKTWDTLAQAAQTSTGAGNCDTPIDLLRTLQLCAFIYQPPASPNPVNCPNFRVAHAAALRGDCPAISALRGPVECGD